MAPAKDKIESLESVSFLRSVLDSLPTIILVKDVETLKFVFINQAAMILTGYLESDLIGKTDSEFFSKEQAEAFLAYDRQAIESGESLDIAEEPIKTKSQSIRYLHCKRLTIAVGSRKYLVRVCWDHTDRKIREEKISAAFQEAVEVTKATLQQWENHSSNHAGKSIEKDAKIQSLIQGIQNFEMRMRLIGDSLPLLVSYIDVECRYEFANLLYQKWCGKHISEILGQTMESVVGKKFFETVKHHVEAVLAGKPVEFSVQTTDLMGRLKEVQVNYMPDINKNGVVQGFVEVTQDLTERKKLEQKNARNVALEQSAPRVVDVKAEMASIISGAIRPLLNKAMSEMETATGDQASLNPTSVKSVKSYLSHIIESLDSAMDISKDGTDERIVAKDVVFDLVTTFQEMEKYFIDLSRGTGFKIQIELDPKLPLFVKGNPGQLRQIVMNLVNTVLKSGANTEVLIQVIALEQSQDYSNIEFKIFDKRSPTIGGALAGNKVIFSDENINASLTKRLVSQMGGEIGTELTRDGGSLCWFRTLFRMPQQTAQAPDPTLPPTAQNPYKDYRVLIVEDNLINATEAVRMLRKMGFQTQVAENGEEALKALRTGSFDFILMDCQMPILDGYQTTLIIRRDIHLPRNIPIIAMTANGMKGDSERCLEAGMDDFIPKPLSDQRLLAALKKWINRIEVYRGGSHGG